MAGCCPWIVEISSQVSENRDKPLVSKEPWLFTGRAANKTAKRPATDPSTSFNKVSPSRCCNWASRESIVQYQSFEMLELLVGKHPSLASVWRGYPREVHVQRCLAVLSWVVHLKERIQLSNYYTINLCKCSWTNDILSVSTIWVYAIRHVPARKLILYNQSIPYLVRTMFTSRDSAFG